MGLSGNSCMKKSHPDNIVRPFAFHFDANLKLNAVSLFQLVPESGIFNVALMKKNIFPLGGCQKSKSFCRIEKLYFAIKHVINPLSSRSSDSDAPVGLAPGN